jgi:hypothetical protein
MRLHVLKPDFSLERLLLAIRMPAVREGSKEEDAAAEEEQQKKGSN